jgi:hypothetical protein
MQPDTKKRALVALQSPAVEFRKERSPRARDLTPADGAVVHSDSHVSVFCASCQRWIDCFDDIPPEVVRERHGERLHS